MFFLQRILIAIVAFVAVMLTALSGQPSVVVAPTENQPAVLETPGVTGGTKASTTSPTTTVPKTPAKKPAATTTPTTNTTPPIKSLADAFADLAAQSPTPTPVPPAVQSVNEEVRAALVNIICTTKASGPLNSISASGVLIHPSGVIITNAHVGQYFLLKDYPSTDSTNCIVRTGSPAYPKYTAELLFLPPSWMGKNAKKIIEEAPTGNGEHDYALLRITGTVSPSVTLPAAFSYLPFSIDPPIENTEVLVAGYPAGFLGGITIAKELYSVSSLSHVGQIYTFGTNTADLFSVGGTIVAQQGSSGGAVADNYGNLTGLITTTTQGATTGSRDLRAVATAYIVDDFAKENGTPFETFMNGNLVNEAQAFAADVAPGLTKQLTDILVGH